MKHTITFIFAAILFSLSAPAFSEYIKSADHQELLQSAQWGIVDDCAQILQITFTLPDGRSYTYSR